MVIPCKGPFDSFELLINPRLVEPPARTANLCSFQRPGSRGPQLRPRYVGSLLQFSLVRLRRKKNTYPETNPVDPSCPLFGVLAFAGWFSWLTTMQMDPLGKREVERQNNKLWEWNKQNSLAPHSSVYFFPEDITPRTHAPQISQKGVV